jgi:uncharacterized membrane protein YfcA
MTALSLLPVIVGCTIALIIAGAVKGVVSLGLPLVGLPLLMLVVDVPTAVNLLMVPIVLSNLVQAFEGRDTLLVLRRFWLMLICLAAGTLLGTALFARLDQHFLLLIIGTFAVGFAMVALLRPHLVIPPTAERWLGPPVGFLAGVIGGMSTLFGPVLATYVVGLRLPPLLFVKSISILYVTAAAMLLLGSASHGTTGAVDIGLSALAMIPVYAGMLAGRRIRHRLDPEKFQLLVLMVVLVTGANMIRTGLGWTW